MSVDGRLWRALDTSGLKNLLTWAIVLLEDRDLALKYRRMKENPKEKY
jgi:hypothetical protein